MTYRFPDTIEQFLMVMKHLDALGIHVTALSNDGEFYVMEVDSNIPANQLEHMSCEVIDAAP